MGNNEGAINLSFHSIEEIIEQITKIGGHEAFTRMNDNSRKDLTVEQNIAIYDQINTLEKPCEICYLSRSAEKYEENGICVFCYEIPYYNGDQYSTFKFYYDETKDKMLEEKYNAVRLYWSFDKEGQVGEFWIHNHDEIIKETDPKRLRELAIEYRLVSSQEGLSQMQIVKQKLAVPPPTITDFSNYKDPEYCLDLKMDDYIFYRRIMIDNIDDENILQMIVKGEYHPEIRGYATSKVKNIDINVLFDLPEETRKYVNFRNSVFDKYSDDEMSKLFQLYYPQIQDNDQTKAIFERWIESSKDQSVLKWLFENHTYWHDRIIISSYHDLNAIRSYLTNDRYEDNEIEDVFHLVIKRLQKENELNEDDCMIVLRHTKDWPWDDSTLPQDYYLLDAARNISNESNQCEVILQHDSIQVCQIILDKISEDTLLSLLTKEGLIYNIFEVICTLREKHSYTIDNLLKWSLSKENPILHDNLLKCLDDFTIDEDIDENLIRSVYEKLKNIKGENSRN